MGNREARRILALKLRGERVWKAKVTDGRRTGRGSGGSWYEAVSEAMRAVDEKAGR